jgi:hypothetical protein
MSQALRGGAAVLAAILGLGGLGFGGVTYFKDRADRERENEIVALPDVRLAKKGERALVEGEISKDVPSLAHEFVAYVERESRKNSNRVVGGQIQPLRILAAHGVVEIVNNDYAFDPWLARWGHLSREVSPPGWTAGAITAQGFLQGYSIVAIGRMNEAGGFDAETIAVGPRTTYLELLRAQNEWQFAWYWLVISPFLLAFAVWQIRAIMRVL